jgi:hypothetical protein
MKKQIILTFLLLLVSAVLLGQNIENGWYKATVEYSNSNTYTNSTYTLNVKVEYNSVVKVDFGNGGSVHTGYNSSGYIWSGGYLMKDSYYDYASSQTLVSYTTTVTINNGSSTSTYEITIK